VLLCVLINYMLLFLANCDVIHQCLLGNILLVCYVVFDRSVVTDVLKDHSSCVFRFKHFKEFSWTVWPWWWKCRDPLLVTSRGSQKVPVMPPILYLLKFSLFNGNNHYIIEVHEHFMIIVCQSQVFCCTGGSTTVDSKWQRLALS